MVLGPSPPLMKTAAAADSGTPHPIARNPAAASNASFVVNWPPLAIPMIMDKGEQSGGLAHSHLGRSRRRR